MRLRRALRPWVDRAAEVTGFLRRWERRMQGGLTILTYHRVLPEQAWRSYPIPSLAMPVEAFRAQVAWLASRCRVLPVGEALTRLAEDRGTSPPALSLTFDDGTLDGHEVVAPILEEHGLRGTFFVTAGALHGDDPLWYDRVLLAWERLGPRACGAIARAAGLSPPAERWSAAESLLDALKDAPPSVRAHTVEGLRRAGAGRGGPGPFGLMDRAHLRDLHRRGHELGSHTRSHAILPGLDEATLRQEVEGARTELQAALDAEVAGFCYPNGDQDPTVTRAVAAAGYRYACTTRPGLNDPAVDPLLLRRMDITRERVASAAGRHSALAFRAEVSGLREVFR